MLPMLPFDPDEDFKIRLMQAFLSASDTSYQTFLTCYDSSSKPREDAYKTKAFSDDEGKYKTQLIGFIQRFKTHVSGERAFSTLQGNKVVDYQFPEIDSNSNFAHTFKIDGCRLVERVRTDWVFCRSLMYNFGQIARCTVDAERDLSREDYPDGKVVPIRRHSI